MSGEFKTIAALKGQVSRFSGIISKGFSKPKRRLIKEFLYGIQAAKDIKLSNISRALREEQALIKTEDRLSRNLDDVDFTEGINEEIMRLAARKVTDEMVIALDPGDIRKKYGKKMEYIAKIHDGSAHEIGEGYWLFKAVAADIEQKKVIPLYFEAYSQDAGDFKSENHQYSKAIDLIFKYIGGRGIHAIDRGGDRGYLYRKYLDKEASSRFVIRLRKQRDLLHKGQLKNGYELSKALPTPHESHLIFYEGGKERKRRVHYNAVPVKLSRYNHQLYLVVVKGFGSEPMMLLTSCKVSIQKKESIWRIVEVYLTRWKCDESYRYIKQCYHLEDIRVRSYVRIRNLVVLLLAVSYFAAVYLGDNLRLKLLVERVFLVSRRFFGVPSFFNYAVADGIYRLLFPDKTALREPTSTAEDFQLVFGFR